MKTNELEVIYNQACQTKGFEQTDGQFKTWKQVLGWCERKDLEVAVARYFEKNVNFPMPAELRTLAGEIMRDREAKTSEKRYLVAWRCLVCGFTQSGFLTMSDRGLRYCRGKFGPLLPVDAPRVNGERPQRAQLPDGVTCGAELRIVNDDRLAVSA